MDDREQQRKVKHRLAVIRHAEEVTGSVAAPCRDYGISRQCLYKWLRRYPGSPRWPGLGRYFRPDLGHAPVLSRASQNGDDND